MADDSEWIKWTGGECPVDVDATVEYRLSFPDATDTFRAGNLDWKTREEGLAIRAYRVVQS